MSERSVEHATFVVERVYDASPDRTFAAWSDPHAKARWYGNPERELELDFRVGGWERHRGTLVDGREYAYQALFWDIVPGRRIVYTYEMLLDAIRISVSVATAEFRPERDGTRLVFTGRARSSMPTRCRPSASRAWAVSWRRSDSGFRAADPTAAEPPLGAARFTFSFPNKGRASAMSFSATDTESIAARCMFLGALRRKALRAACDSQRSNRLTRSGSSKSTVMTKSRIGTPAYAPTTHQHDHHREGPR
jgi:uncharacterized protein YndB with AHSA1/START domain